MDKITAVVTRIENAMLRAEFHTSSGRLRICEDGVVTRDFLPPDSWIMIASCSAQSRWGTRPSRNDLMHVLQQYARPSFTHDPESYRLRDIGNR